MEVVEQVIPVAEIAAHDGATAPVRGVVDVHGEVTPVIDLGRSLAETWTELHLDQQFILVNGSVRRLILLADEVEGVQSMSGAGTDGDLIFVGGVLATDVRGC